MVERYAYIILGSRGGGRREVLADLVDFGIPSEQPTEVIVSDGDAASWGEPLPIRHENCIVSQFAWRGIEAGLGIEPTGEAVFVVADGLADPSDFVEAFFDWLKGADYELGRIITVADCARIQKEKQLLLWYDCCIHFSDVVLLSNRKDVPNKWVDEFKDRYLKEYYPCLFEFVKKGRLSNPSLVLEPQARRISRLFDETDEFVFIDEDVEIEDEGDVDEEEEDEEFEAGDPSKDPFLARMVNGRREKTLPDVGKLIS